MRTAIVIPSLGAPHLETCLQGVANLEPAAETVTLVLSNGAEVPQRTGAIKVMQHRHRLGFAAAVNAGIDALPSTIDAVAILNDDAVPDPNWLGTLSQTLDDKINMAAVQGTVTDISGQVVDGRGIKFDHWGLPVQVDYGLPIGPDEGTKDIIAVSGTAPLLRMDALRQAVLPNGEYFDSRFGSYFEDLDLGLRMTRLGWRTSWIGNSRVRHLGSATGSRLCWRHPWWVLANRWRTLAGNLSKTALIRELPRLVRGEVRAVRTLFRDNRRSLFAEAAVLLWLPILIAGGWQRRTTGPRLETIPGLPT